MQIYPCLAVLEVNLLIEALIGEVIKTLIVSLFFRGRRRTNKSKRTKNNYLEDDHTMHAGIEEDRVIIEN